MSLILRTSGKDGVYQVKDTMNARFVNRIDPFVSANFGTEIWISFPR